MGAMNIGDTITIKAYAKVNLTLGVLYKRMDGYHALDSLMQGVDLFDRVNVERASDVAVTAYGMTLPYNNTLKKAADSYCALTGRGAHIRVEKRIPAQAGLGGGSADGAAVLYGLDQLYGDLDGDTLNRLALQVGADVPFLLWALRGGSLARAQGVGEALEPLNAIPMHFVLAKPARGVSTKALFSALKLPRQNPDNIEAMAAIANGDLPGLGKRLFNGLEEPATALVPEIGELQQALLEAGALGASMSGSGSTVFGLFDTLEAAKAALPAVEKADFCCTCSALK